MEKLNAFHGKQSVKDFYLNRVREHEKNDEIVQGIYWENGRGCGVGCTIEGSEHNRYEKELGIPEEIAFLEDIIFEELTNGDAKAFPAQFLNAIKPGADLSKVVAKLVIWQFEDEKWGLKNIQEVKDDKEIYGLCEEVVALYRRSMAEEVKSSEYLALYEEIDEAWAGARAWAWARAWAGARAWAWARARVWAGARVWARAGAGAGAGAGAQGNERTRALRDEFIRLLSECV